MKKDFLEANGTYPILPVIDTLVFPTTSVYLLIGKERSMSSVNEAQRRDGHIVIVGRKKEDSNEDGEIDEYKNQFYKKGTLCLINHISGTQNTGFKILVTGLMKFKIQKFNLSNSYYEGEGIAIPEEPNKKAIKNPLIKQIKYSIEELIKLLPDVGLYPSKHVGKISNPIELVYLATSYLNLETEQLQKILEEQSIIEKMELIKKHLRKEREVLMLEKDIKDKVSVKLTKIQRNALLTEQLNVIKDELGESDENTSSEYKKKLNDLQLPKETYDIIFKEIDKLSKLNINSSEYYQKIKYLDDFFEVPWSKYDSLEIDIQRCEKILNENHYNLEKVKKRIIQHIAVAKLKGHLRGTILCLVGPPGVGKTSLGKSIAKSLGRKFARISLGGVNDEAEIRGHRQTYIGSMPGKIIQSLISVGVNNPVIMFDEIDKINNAYGKGVSSAMLEVLDPEQNDSFVDHYLNVPFDLSNAFFICTANLIETIPAPLRDRMEVIQLSSYTLNEKLHIGNQYIIPQSLVENGISPKDVKISQNVLKSIIKNYTREAGVREVKRKIDTVCRGIAYKIVKGEIKPININSVNLHEFLGPIKYLETQRIRKWYAGIATGLAWTPVGGDIVYIECISIPGKGNLKITGQLGDVMKESAELAFSYIKSKKFKFHSNFDFENNDIHLHIPAGSIPKDGPSAGITILCALISLVTNLKVDQNVAMTGEITLSGSILAVGGIKEKLIAAYRHKLQTVLLPKQNSNDLYEIPQELLNKLKFKFIDSVEEAINEVFKINLTHDYIQMNKGDQGEYQRNSKDEGIHSKH